MSHTSRNYLPAAGHDWSLPFYDPMVKLMGGESAQKSLVEQAALLPGQRVLDVGCGTGTMDVMIKRLHPDVEVIGLDPDPKALARATRKAVRSGLSIRFDRGFVDQLPYAEGSFDRVLSSFMFHHVPGEDRGRMMEAIRRVLKSGGELHLLDFEGPEDSSTNFLARLFHANERLKDNSVRRVLSLMTQAGFASAQKVGRKRLLFGTIAYYRASI